MTDHDFVNAVLNQRPVHVPPSYPERQKLAEIYENLTGYGATISGLNRLRSEPTIPPDVAQRILVLQEDLIKWRANGQG